jgi:hypothetical protein
MMASTFRWGMRRGSMGMFWLVRPASTRVRVSKAEIYVVSRNLHTSGWTYGVVVGVVALERVSDLGNIVILTADFLEDTLDSAEGNTADTAGLGILKLQQSSTE